MYSLKETSFEKCRFLYDMTDCVFELSLQLLVEFIDSICLYFTKISCETSELKTVLIISKAFTPILNNRISILEKYKN